MKSCILEKVTSWTVWILVSALAAATLTDRISFGYVSALALYHHPVFISLWGVLTVLTVILLVRRKVWRRPAVALMHLSFILMLVGALVTHLWGREGVLHLREGESVTEPVEVMLEEFDITFYDGSAMPKDYCSRLRTPDGVLYVSMNHIARTGGYRFCQFGYDEDLMGTTLGCSRDPVGTGLSYSGYCLLFISALMYMCGRVSFRRKSFLLPAICVLTLLILAMAIPAGDVLRISEDALTVRILYALAPSKVPAIVCLTGGIVLFFMMLSEKFGMIGRRAAMTVTAVALACVSFLLLMKWILSGHVPLSTGDELMTCIAWMALLMNVTIGRRTPLVQPVGLICAGFGLMVASMGASNPESAPLVPVLASPLLAVHVGCMMVSYTFLGLAAVNSVPALVTHRSALTELNRIILPPAVLILTCGTFVGAIWANISWGSYWSWDPKETWALITCLVYSFALHRTGMRSLEKENRFNIFCLAAFLTVLITYFGVNFFLGGIHSYA